MNTIACPSLERLFAFAVGELPESAVIEVAEHLDRCVGCGELAAQFDRATDPILVGLKLIGDSGLSALVAARDTEAWAEPKDVALLAENWGEFRIVREIGRGGMGVVYEAFQESLNRHIALKLLREPADLARFRREARAAGRLHHTNIVPVHGVGEHSGRHYYVMQYIAGRGLDEVLQARREPGGDGIPAAAVDFREVARIALQAAEAVAYAHDQRIVHRDIKPSNILLDGRGTVWITDFGLAYDSDDTQTLTHTGDLLGTIRYMAPERFAGRTDAGADIYGLGATLYELATGQAAFAHADRAVLIHRVLHEDPPPPRQLDPRVPRDLETIVLKAMAREPSHRYATAAELAGDLRRFVEDRPIRARRVGAWERGVRWCRRNPLAAGLLAGLVLVFLGGFAGVTVQWRRAEAAGTRAANEALRANAESARAGALARAEAEARAAEKALRIRAQAAIVARDFDRGLELARRGDGDIGMLWMGEALRQAPPEEPAVTRVLQASLAAWPGPSPPLRAILEHRGSVYALFRPDGRAILTGSRDGTARLWDAATGRPLGPPLAHGDIVFQVAFSPDGRRVLTGGLDGKVRTWDLATGQATGPTLVHGEEIWHVEYAPGGQFLLTHGRDLAVRLWDAATGRLVGPPIGAGLIGDAHFSPDGRLLLTGGRDGRARLWDVATGRPAGPPLRHDRLFFTLFSPDGRLIVTGSEDGTVSLWEAATRQPVAPPMRHGSSVHGAVLSPDARLLLTLRDDSTARIDDAASGRPIASPLRHGGWISSAVFSPDGRLIATSSSDRTARLWDVATGRPLGPPLRHRLRVDRVAFSPDGRLLLTASDDGTVKVWEIDRAEAGAAVVRAEDSADATPAAAEPGLGFTGARFSPDRSRVILIGQRGLARLVDVESGQPVGQPMEQRWPRVRSAAFSPDGTRVAIASHDAPFGGGGSTSSACRIWDAAAGQPASPVLPLVNWVAALAFRPDGEVLATGDYRGAVHLWDVRTGACVSGPLYAGYIVLSLAFSPDGRVLAAGTAHTGNQAIAWDLATSRPIGEPVGFRGQVRHLAFSGDGTRLAAGATDGTVQLIEAATGRVIGEPLRNDGWVGGLAFSPDGRSVLTVSEGKGGTSAARLWDARSGRPTSPGMAHPARIAEDALAFSPDGSAFATGCVDGSVRIWHAATSRPIGPTRMLRGPALGVAFDRDGRSLFAVDDHGDVRTWALREPPVEPVERLIGRVHVRTGIELDATKEVAVIGPAEWRRRRETDESGPTPEPASEAGWHEECARNAEAIGDGFAARWHLDRLIAARPDDGLLHARRARTRLWAQDVQSADADLDRALELGPRDRIADWLTHRAADSLADDRPADALRLLDRAVTARPGNWLAYSLRAEMLAKLGRPAEREVDLARASERGADIPFLIRLAAERSRAGRWAEAVPLYDRAIAMGTVPYEVWNEAATAHLEVGEVGDEPGYRRVCEVMRGRHPAAIPDILVRATLAGVLTLGPGGVGVDSKGSGWAENLPATAPPERKDVRRWLQRVLAAVLFRAGRPAEASERLREGIAIGGGPAEFEETVFLAMAAFQGGDRARARALLSELGDGRPDGPSSSAWWEAEARRVLHREAERMILDGDFPADPFAR